MRLPEWTRAAAGALWQAVAIETLPMLIVFPSQVVLMETVAAVWMQGYMVQTLAAAVAQMLAALLLGTPIVSTRAHLGAPFHGFAVACGCPPQGSAAWSPPSTHTIRARHSPRRFLVGLRLLPERTGMQRDPWRCFARGKALLQSLSLAWGWPR